MKYLLFVSFVTFLVRTLESTDTHNETPVETIETIAEGAPSDDNIRRRIYDSPPSTSLSQLPLLQPEASFDTTSSGSGHYSLQRVFLIAFLFLLSSLVVVYFLSKWFLRTSYNSSDFNVPTWSSPSSNAPNSDEFGLHVVEGGMSEQEGLMMPNNKGRPLDYGSSVNRR